MTGTLRITRAGPSATVQDAGRFGMLQHGISASGPMDRRAFDQTGAALSPAATSGLEFSRAGIDFVVDDAAVQIAFAGGAFVLRHNGEIVAWPGTIELFAGDRVEITPGPAGNYGYVRFDREIGVPPVLGSRATNLIAGLGGLSGRALRASDVLPLGPAADPGSKPVAASKEVGELDAIRFIWGIHADLFAPRVRQAFVEGRFAVSTRLDRMGVRLEDREGVFSGAPILSLVSDAVVAGDVQILGDGTPIVLMRDHQPTGGYPRIATIVSADLSGFAQLRPGSTLAFVPVSLQKARLATLESRA